MENCTECKKSFEFLELKNNLCKSCTNNACPTCSISNINFTEDQLVKGSCNHCQQNARPLEVVMDEINKVVLTTEVSHNIAVNNHIEIITAECTFAMNAFEDLFSGDRGFFEGRSKDTQDTLRYVRKSALHELKKEAHLLEANAVVGVNLSYSEVSGGGKSMLFVVASGTAVEANLSTAELQYR